MSSFIFILKSAILTGLIICLMQIPIGEKTIENKTHEWLIRSGIGQTIQSTAAGGVVFIRQTTRDLVRKTKGLFKSGENTEKASRTF
jgi:hypothetical protein